MERTIELKEATVENSEVSKKDIICGGVYAFISALQDTYILNDPTRTPDAPYSWKKVFSRMLRGCGGVKRNHPEDPTCRELSLTFQDEDGKAVNKIRIRPDSIEWWTPIKDICILKGFVISKEIDGKEHFQLTEKGKSTYLSETGTGNSIRRALDI